MSAWALTSRSSSLSPPVVHTTHTYTYFCHGRANLLDPKPASMTYFIGAVLDISQKTTVAHLREMVMSQCFAGCLVQAGNYCSNRCCGLRNSSSNVRPTDAAGVKPPGQTLAPGVSCGSSCWCMRLLLAKNERISNFCSLDNNRRKFPSSFRALC